MDLSVDLSVDLSMYLSMDPKKSFKNLKQV